MDKPDCFEIIQEQVTNMHDCYMVLIRCVPALNDNFDDTCACGKAFSNFIIKMQVEKITSISAGADISAEMKFDDQIGQTAMSQLRNRHNLCPDCLRKIPTPKTRPHRTRAKRIPV